MHHRTRTHLCETRIQKILSLSMLSTVCLGLLFLLKGVLNYFTADSQAGDEVQVDLDQGNNNVPGPVGPQLHEIKIIYHPASKRPEQHFNINNNLPGVSASTGSSDPVNVEAPWHPFRSRLDFEIAELSLNAHLSKADTEHLLSIIRRCIETPEQFTLSGHKDLSEYWDMARSMTDCVSSLSFIC
jgi:hypothetical protein